MLILLSPAKTQQFKNCRFATLSSSPFISDSKTINLSLKSLTLDEISNLMKLKEPLAKSTYDNIHKWNENGNDIAQVDALSGFSGPAFKALNAETLSASAVERSKKQLIILSGLYGILHADNRLMPYRLEMGLSYKPDKIQSLTKYWQPRISTYLSEYCNRNSESHIINLASAEYSKAVVIKDNNISFITIDFKELRSGKLKSISSYAKQARGLMARFILESNPENLDDIKIFSQNGYAYSPENSTDTLLTFIRES